MDHDDRLFFEGAFLVVLVEVVLEVPVKVLHPLQEKSRIKAKVKDFLEAGHLVIFKLEICSERTLGHIFLLVLVIRLITKVVNLHHLSVPLLQEASDVRPPIAEDLLVVPGWEPARNDTIRNVS